MHDTWLLPALSWFADVCSEKTLFLSFKTFTYISICTCSKGSIALCPPRLDGNAADVYTVDLISQGSEASRMVNMSQQQLLLSLLNERLHLDQRSSQLHVEKLFNAAFGELGKQRGSSPSVFGQVRAGHIKLQ